jgi:hypothetical protein
MLQLIVIQVFKVVHFSRAPYIYDLGTSFASFVFLRLGWTTGRRTLKPTPTKVARRRSGPPFEIQNRPQPAEVGMVVLIGISLQWSRSEEDDSFFLRI